MEKYSGGDLSILPGHRMIIRRTIAICVTVPQRYRKYSVTPSVLKAINVETGIRQLEIERTIRKTPHPILLQASGIEKREKNKSVSNSPPNNSTRILFLPLPIHVQSKGQQIRDVRKRGVTVIPIDINCYADKAMSRFEQRFRYLISSNDSVGIHVNHPNRWPLQQVNGFVRSVWQTVLQGARVDEPQSTTVINARPIDGNDSAGVGTEMWLEV